MEITDVQFQTLSERPHPTWVIRIKIIGGAFTVGGTVLRATVGHLEVEGLAHLIGGNGIVGYLTEEPAIGAELRVGYADEELVDTGFTYQPPVT